MSPLLMTLVTRASFWVLILVTWTIRTIMMVVTNTLSHLPPILTCFIRSYASELVETVFSDEMYPWHLEEVAPPWAESGVEPSLGGGADGEGRRKRKEYLKTAAQIKKEEAAFKLQRRKVSQIRAKYSPHLAFGNNFRSMEPRDRIRVCLTKAFDFLIFMQEELATASVMNVDVTGEITDKEGLDNALELVRALLSKACKFQSSSADEQERNDVDEMRAAVRQSLCEIKVWMANKSVQEMTKLL